MTYGFYRPHHRAVRERGRLVTKGLHCSRGYRGGAISSQVRKFLPRRDSATRHSRSFFIARRKTRKEINERKRGRVTAPATVLGPRSAMSTTDPTGEGGGGGGEGAMSANAEQNASPSTPNTGTTVPVQATTQQQQQHPPPSPLSGCYLLVVLPEPHTAQHKDLILNRLAKGFLSWDKDSCHVDLEKELLALVAQAPEGEEARNGERLIQYATENLVTEVLIHPQTNTLLQCIRNLLASFTKHRHIIHAGYTFGGNGSWILQDGTFSLADFLDAFSEHEVQRVLRAYENSVTVDIHCAGIGDWTTSRLSKEACCRFCRVRVNPDDVLTAGMPAITSFTNYIGQYLVPQTLDQLMEPSDVVGNIRFSHPTLYVFPGGQGDAALFGINGFNMLVDGGFARKACFWDFTRHLDRLDAVLVTRINNSNIGGMFSVLRKKKELHVYPQIGHFFCNLVERRQSNSPDGDKDIDPLILNLTDIGQEMVLNLRHINLRAHPCYRDSEPINLYHKVGHGTLDMYVLSPSKDSREVREFLSKWHASDSKLFAGSHKKDSNNLTFPIQNLVSICALLVWQPANPEDNITRILFPGSTPQHKIFEGFERLKHLDFLKHPVCSAKTLSPSTSLATLRDKPIKKFGLIEKESKKISEPKKEKREPSEPKSIKPADETISKTTPQSTPIIPTSKLKTETKMKKVAENKKIETEAKESKKIEKELKDVKKESKKEPIKVEKREDEIKKGDLIKLESDKTASKEIKEYKVKPEPKKKEAKESKIKTELKKSEVTPKPKSSEKRAKPSGTEKKDAVKSSPTTPKKTLNGTATRTEISKAAPKTKLASKAMPSLPAKSAKEANNRKVVEQKKSEVEKSAVRDVAAPAVKVSAKPKPTDRKPISRRTKPVSPSKARMPGSPAKSTRSTPTTSVKSDKDGVIRKVKGDKGTTDSSTVSTPSGIEPESVKPIDKSLIEQSEDMSLDSIESKVLADLKEEREVVEEIEAVLQKAERIEEIRKDDRFEGDDEITAEAIDKKEEDITEEDVTAEIEDMPKKEGSRKESQELTEEDEYLIVEKEEVYTEDSAQSGEGEQKHVLDDRVEKGRARKEKETVREKGQRRTKEKKKEEKKKKEKKIDEIAEKEEIAGLSSEHKEQLQKEVKEIIASAAEIVQKAEEKDDSAKKDSEDITKEPSSLSPDKLDSSEKKTDTDVKPDVDQKEHILEKREESQERISTIESGATTTAPTLPEDERIPLDEIKEDIDEKHVIEEVKEKDAPMKLKEEVVPETVSVKPEVKVFDVRQAMQNLQRDIVKTPDEVADLPVHEEVDPKLYRMEDFEKGKEEKPSPTTQEIKELPTPPVKEQKGVFSFFGKVADKFEKGIDKLTKKSKKESDKDSDEKSSSKSSSPKEAKLQEKTLFEEVDVEKMFPKVGKPADKPEIFEEVKPTIVDVKTAAIKDTAAFIQEEIFDAQKKSVSDIEEKLSIEKKLEDIKKAEAEIEEALFAKDVSPKPVDDKEIAKEIELLKEEDIGEDAEEVKALLEEASKKFKTVKDSLRDSLESLEEKVKEEEMQHDVSPTLKDIVKDTLEGVAEKLEEIKPHIESSLDIKEPEKVKFAIPKDEEFEEEYEEEPEGPYRDMKEAVRDVGEVLAGTAGIDLEDKPKDVIEIVKKVAEVLKEDDFLSDKTLFDQASKKEEISSIPDRKPSKEEISTERKLSIPSEKVTQEKDTKLKEDESKLAYEDIVTSKKIDVAEVFPVHEKAEELIEKSDKLLVSSEKPDAVEVKEEPCVKMFKKQDDMVTSPMKDVTKDKKDVQEICAEMLKDDICDQHKKLAVDDTSQVDVMQAGIESICVKEMAKRPSFEDKLESGIEHPVISFEQKVSPAKAEIVMVTPGSTPTSPKFSADKIYDKELEIGLQELPKLPDDIKQVLSKEAPVEEVIEELIITKKKRITIEVIEYITVVKRIPRERVIYIIEEIIVKKGLSRESVVDDPEILKLKEDITPEKRMEVEDYIVNEYIIKEKRITIEIIEEISIKKIVPKKIVIEIIEEIIVKRKIARHMVLDIPEEVLSEIIKEESPEESPEESAEEQITPKIDITAKRESIAEVSTAPIEVEEPIILQKREEIEEFVVNEYIIKEKKITASIIDEISAKKAIPKKILVEIIEEIIVKKKIPRNVLLDVTEEELDASMISKTTPEDKEEKKISETEILKEKRKSIIEVPSAEISEMKELVTSQQRAEIEEYIVEEYVTKEDSINVQKLEEICSKKKISKRIIIEIIEEIIIKRKIPRHTVLGITEEELSHIIKEEVSPELEVLAEKRKSIAEVLSPDEKKKIPVELKKDVPEHEVSEEKLSPTSEKDIEEEEEEEEVDGFVSIPRKSFDEKKKEISPIKTEVLPVTVKEHEKDAIDDFEAVEQEYKVHDVSITSPEKADEMKEKEDIEETAEDTMSEVIEADEKFVQETKEKVGKEEPQVDIEKDIKLDDKKRELEEPETSEISEIVDTTEKYLDEAKEKTDDVSSKEKSLIEKVDELTIVEEKEILKDISDKRSSIDIAAVPEAVLPSTKLIDEKAAPDKTKEIEPAKEKVEELITKDDKSKPTSPIKDETKDIVFLTERLLEKVEGKPETKLTDATDFAQEPTTELLEDIKSKLLEPTEIKETPITKKEESPQELSEEALHKKTSISIEPEVEIIKSKDELHVEDVKPLEKIKDEKYLADKSAKVDEGSGTVKRMLVTACSEDGREETEICPTGSITFTKTVTPDDSLKDVSVKSTPDKDSLLLDKDSLHSSVSTPEKDSISEKSVPEGKDKITSEDSLEKSPRDSQDLEDSLEKLELQKPKDIKIPLIDDNKPKAPEKSEDIIKPKSPMEKEDLKAPDKIAAEDALPSPEEKRKPESPVKDTEIEKVKLMAEEKIEKPKSPTKDMEKIEKSPSSSEIKHDDVQKSKLSPDTTAEKSPVESTEKPTLPIEKVQSEKIGTTGVSKTPESLRSEDVSPAETIFSKSPTDKPEMYFTKTSISEEDVVSEAVTEKLSEAVTEKLSTKEIKSIVDKELESKEKTPSPESKDQTSEKLEMKELDLKSTSPVIVTSTDEKAPLEKSISPSISSEKHEEKDVLSISSEKSDDNKSICSKSPVSPDKEEKEDVIDKYQLPSIVSASIDKKMSEVKEKPEEKEPVDKSKTPSITSEKSEQDIKSPDSVLSDKTEEKETVKLKSPSAVDKETISEKLPILESEEHYDEKGPIDEVKSPSAISDRSDEKKEAERSKSPSIATDKSDLQDVTEHYLEKQKSPIFDRPESPKDIDKTEEQDKSRSPSVASDKSDSKKVSSRSPSISVEKIDLKDMDLPIERAQLPSIAIDKDDKLEELPISKSPIDKTEVSKDAQKSPKLDEIGLKEIQSPLDKSRSSSVTSTISESKESGLKEKSPSGEFVDKSKSSSLVDQKLDVEEKESSEKSRSSSIVKEQHIPQEIKKSPSSVEEKLKDLTQEPIDKSRSSSVSSIVTDEKEPADHLKSSSTVDEKPDLKGVEEPSHDKSRSPSVISVTEEQKEPIDLSKSPSIAGEKLDLKDIIDMPPDKSRSSSITSVTSTQKAEHSKSPSIAGEKPDIKDVTESVTDKSRSPSVISIAEEKKEPFDHSKSPSVIDEKPDLKDVTEQLDEKFRSASVGSITSEQKETTDRSKSPSITDEKPDLKDVVDQQIEKAPSDKSKSPSAVSDSKEPEERSKSPSIAEDKSDEKEPTADKSRSTSVVSITSEQKETTDRSKSPSITDEKPDLKDVVDQQIEKAPSDKSKSPSAVSDSKEPEERSKSPSIAEDKSDEKEPTADKSRSTSVVSITSEQKETTDRSKSPSIAGEKPDLKDIVEQQIEQTPSDKSKSPTALSDSKEPEERSKSPSIAEDKLDEKEPTSDKSRSTSVVSITSEQKETTDRSKSPSIAGEKPDLKDVVEQQIEKAPSDKSKSPSAISDSKEPEERSKSPSIAEDKLDEKESTADKSRSTSVVSITSEQKETTDRSKSPSIPDEKPDLKDVVEQQIEKAPSDKSKSPSAISDSKEPEERSKSPSIAEDKSDEKEPTADKSRSTSVVSITSEQKETTDRSKSPSIADEKPDLKDVVEQPIEKTPSDKSKSPTAMSDSKEPEERSKSPSIAEDKSEEKESTVDKSRSASVVSIASEQKETTDRSKSPSIADEKPDLKDVAEQQIEKALSDKSKSPSAISDSREPEEGSKSPSIAEDKSDEKEPTADKSRSTSVVSITSEQKETIDRSKSPSIAGEKPDLKDVVEQQIEKAPSDKSKSPSAMSDSKEPGERSKSPSIAEDKLDEKEPTADKSRSTSVISITSEQKETTDRSKSPSIADEKPDLKDVVEQQIEKAPSDKSKSPSPISDSKEPEERLKSPSIAEDKSDEKESTADKSRSASVISITSEPKEITDRSKSPSIAGEKLDLKDVVEQQIEKTPSDISKSPIALNDSKEPEERLKSPTIAEDKSDEKDPTADKSRSASVVSITSEPKEITDRSKSPSIAGEKPDLKDVVEQQIEKAPSDKSKSPSAISDSKEPEERLKSPSIAEDKSDEKESTADKSRSASVVSITIEPKEITDRSKSPSIAGEKPDLKDVVEQQIEKTPSDKSKSPTALSDSKEPEERLKSPSIAEDKSDEKEPTTDKSRSASVVSITSEPKEITDRSKSPSIVGEKPDLKDVVEQQIEKTPSDKSKSPSAISDSKEPEERLKSPSIAEDKSDEKEPTADKSRSASVVSITGKAKEITDRSKSPSIAGEKPDLKDVVEQQIEKTPSDKSKSPSAISDSKEPEERSKSPSIAEDKSDEKESTADKSRSTSVVSITSEQKETTDRSKSPSIAGEKPDLKDVVEQQIEKAPSDKSKSPSAMSDSKEPGERSKSPSIAEDKLDEKEPTADKSRSTSVISITSEQKETTDRSKSPSIADEKAVLKDVVEQQVEKLPSDKSDDKKSIGDSKSSSITEDKSDLTDVTEHPLDKSKSSSITSITSDQKEPTEKAKLVLDKEEGFDRSKSPSVASEKSEEAKSILSSKPSSVAGDTADLSELPVDKSRSPSVISVTTDQKEPIEIPISPPTVSQTIKEPHDRSKSPSIASEKSSSRKASITEDKPDLKDIIEPPIDKSRSSSVVSLTTEKAESFGKSISLTTSDKLEPPVDQSKFPSTASDKSDGKVTDSKVGTKEYYEDASDKSPSLIDVKPSTVIEKLDIKSDDDILHDKSQSSSIVLDKRSLEKIDIDGLKTAEQELIDKARSLSIISDKTEPKSPSDVSKSSSLTDDKFDQKEKSRSSSVASEKLDDIDAKIAPSLDIGKIPKDESAKSSQASSPLDKTPKDRSRSQSVIDIGDKIPASRSRTASLFDDKLPEKVLSQDEKDTLKHIDTKQSFDEKDEDKSSPQEKKSPATSPEMIQKEMRKIREKRFADFGEPGTIQPRTIEKADDEEEDIIKITAEKKAEIEKYILEEFIVRKRKISLIVIEKLVMTYSVPQFIVMEIIEDIISRQNIPKSAVFDFVDDESSESQYEKEMATLPPQKKADVEKYITEEFIAKKKKVTPEMLEEIVILKGLPRYIIITIIEEIIVTKHIPRNTLIEGDLEELREKSPDIIKKRDESIVPADLNLEQIGVTQEYHEKPSAIKDEDGKISPTDSAQDTKALSASPSLSPEPIPSDKSTQDSPVRSEPHIDEEILISEEKRTEIEKLLEEEYIKKGRRITEVILEEIIIRTSLPRYIILEIVEEIIIKRKIPRESVVDVEIYQEEEPEEDYDKAVYGYDRTADVSYELPHDARKSSIEYRMSGMYAEPSERQLDKSDYPMDYESQFHKAFVGGMTEMRTTHITTLSGKSTPEFATHDATPESGIEAADKTSEKLPESTLTTTHITDVEDSKIVQPMQTITILRESKITEPHLPEESPEKHDAKHEIIDKDESEKETIEILKEDKSSDEIVIKKIVKREILEQEEAETETSGEPATKSDSDVIVVKKIIKREIVEPQEESESVETKETKRPSVQQDEPDAITKIIKREIVEHDEPEVVTKVVKREIIEQDEPEIITKVIRREIVVPDEETSDSKEDSGEYVKTITTKTTRTILTEELPDTELSQTDPSKIYKDPTSGTTYRVVSDESVPDVTSSADVKRIVTMVTTITGPDGKVTTKKDVKESTDTVDSEKLLEELIDSDKMATETTKSAEKIIKETITTVTSGTSTPDAKIYDSGKSTPDLKQGDKFESTVKERLGADKFEHSVSPLVRDLISDDKSYSGKSSPDISLPKDIVFSGSTGKSTPEIPMSPLIRDGAAIQPHLSGRSTPDRRSDGRSSTGTPEGFRSGEVIRTTITTTKMISDEGEIVTTTREVTETTNEKGETVVLAEKTDVKVDERLPSKDAAESAINNIIGSIKSSESQRSGSPASDDATSDKGDPLSEHGKIVSQTQWGSREERHTFSDDEPPSSPLSSTSQVGYSPQTTHRHELSSDKEDEQKEQQVEFSAAAMSSSFYGELPAVPAQISAMKTFHGETGVQKSSDPVHSRFMVEKEFAGYGEKPDAKRYVDEADLDFDKALMEHKEMKEANGAFSSGIAPRYTNGSLRHEDEAKDHPSSSFRDDKDDSKGDSKKDPLEGWGTPLGLPSPKPPKKFNLKNPAQASCSSESTSDILNFDVLKDWGEPLRLPSPAPTTNEVSNKGAPGTPKKERKQAKKVQSENIKNKKRSESPAKNEKKLKDSKNKIQPVYMDLAYVPHHGNSYYTSLEFFKRVRARYYVFSGTEPSREVYDALLEAKKTWEDKDLEVTMIPTYDTDTLGYWVADNEEALAANHIDLSPSASRCTINLQDHETSCSAYRLEF
ncbi:LOW QUALITY PROTEIN: microtubule-associated protein futsch [Camponotus floridanus]|uniref:LOW QUALITY PROTEIN: microtubule-associated protein futsch n=1 Tax=Camponotus floridanus TaxID=104421 RepID=UPI000DC6B0C7|nr:LOW QUALITY PROTEIN: microtubule-associated protein futsch [Camponotus floridanus]